MNGSEGSPARLAWYTVEKDDGYAGDILAAFELFLVSRGGMLFYTTGGAAIFHSCSHCAPVVRKNITYASHYAVKFGSVRRAERTTGFPLLATVEQYGKGTPF